MFVSAWKKSSKSNPSGNCVQSRKFGVLRQVRDTKLAEDSPVLSVSESDFGALIDSLRK